MSSRGWLTIYISRNLFIADSEKSRLVEVPGGEYRFWLTKKLIKQEISSKKYYILYKKDFTANLFISKQINGEWKKIDEKKVLISSLLNSFKLYEEVSTTQSKYLITYSNKTSYKIGFVNSEFMYVSFWLHENSIEIKDKIIRITLPTYKKINISILEDDDNEITIKYSGVDLINYIRDEISTLNWNRSKTPTVLPKQIDVKIETELQDEANTIHETSMLQTTTSLYKHQAKAVAKLLPTRYGALFMEMGTGKTRTALELIKIRQSKISKFIWITPVSLKSNVKEEIVKHSNIKASDIYIFNDKTDDQNIPDKFAYILGIESIGMSDRVYLALNSLVDNDSFIIVDESSFIKGNSQQSRRIIKSTKNTRYRLILTGTPISQGIIDLYNQMRFLSPKIFGYKSFYAFANYHIKYSSKYSNQILGFYNETYLAEKMKPYVYQVTKEECLTLPEKNYIDKYFSMSDAQRVHYEEAKEELLFQVDISDIDGTNILKLFTRLQQIVSGFYKNSNDEIITITNSRVTFLSDIIQEIDKDKKIIVWSKFIYDIKIISNMISENFGEDSFVVYTGEQNENEKSISLNKFKDNPDVRFFIATQSSGAYGLTLTESYHAIFYNNTFKYSQRIQAEDRIHRIGQTEITNYINISCLNSIDTKINSSIFKKANIISDFKREMDTIKDKKLKKALLSAIIDGNLELAEQIKLEDMKKNNTAAKRMEKMRRKRGVIPREEYILNSISNKKPWEELGISRATWYRKK